MARKFSPAQQRYLIARAAFDAAETRYRAHGKVMDAEGERLAIPGPYVILPEDHPMMIEAQSLLDAYNAALRDMHAAAATMFDWALDTTFARMGTPKQKTDIREAFQNIKKMSHVQKIWKDAVDTTLKLAA